MAAAKNKTTPKATGKATGKASGKTAAKASAKSAKTKADNGKTSAKVGKAAKQVKAKPAPAKAKAATAKETAAKLRAAKTAKTKETLARTANKRAAAKPASKTSTPPSATKTKSETTSVSKKTIKTKFKVGTHIVYPAHGVGRIIDVEQTQVVGMELELYVIEFDKEKMKLRVPVDKAEQLNMRALASPDVMKNAFQTLKGRARIKRTMWSRRAQEYEAKINSGDPVSIAEVVRDLHRSGSQPEQSYSERQIYESALERLAREVAALENIAEEDAVERLENQFKAA